MIGNIGGKRLEKEEVLGLLVPMIESLHAARIVFDGFTLPEEFGCSEEMEYGNHHLAKAHRLASGSVDMGKSFVLKTLEDLFSGELGEFVPDGTGFILTCPEAGLFKLSAMEDSERL